MSELYDYPHELCGVLAGQPLYHPLASFTLGKTPVTREDILLGDGNPDRPMPIFDIAGCITDLFFSEEFVEYYVNDDESSESLELVGSALHKLARPISTTGLFLWSGEEWVDFMQAAQAPRSFGTAHVSGGRVRIDEWIRTSLGEYALLNMSDIIIAKLDTAAAGHLKRWITTVSEAPRLCNVLSVPQGYEKMGGRRVFPGDGNLRK